MTTPIAIILVITVLTIILAIKARSSKAVSVEEWTVGGRRLGQAFVLFLLAGEIYTVFTFLGATGFAYSNGVAVYYILSYCVIAYLISYFLLPPIWRYAKHHKIITQPQFLAHRYNSPLLGHITTVVGVLALIPYIVIQLRGMGAIVSEVSDQSVSPSLSIFIGALVMSLYVVISGLRGSAYVAIVKDIAVFFVIVFLGIYIPIHFYGSIPAMFQSIEAARPEMTVFNPENKSIAWYVSTVVVVSLGFFMTPQIFLTVCSASDENSFKKNAMILPLYSLLLLFAFFVGFAAILQIPDLPGRESDFALFRIIKEIFPDWALGIVGSVGILTAIVPGSIIVITAASLISNGVAGTFLKNTSPKNELLLSQILVPIISLLCCYLAISSSGTMVTIQLISYGMATQFVWVVIAAALPRKPYFTAQGAASGIIAGVLVSACTSLDFISPNLLWMSVAPSLAQLDGGVLALMVNLIIALSVSWLTKRSPPQDYGQTAEV